LTRPQRRGYRRTVRDRRTRRRFWLEAVGAVASALLLVLTLISKEWIEVIFGVDPDHGSGALEWLIVGACALVALTCSLLARFEWRRRRTAHALGDA
jgi:apolipoprotein N-acyltransferase